MNARSSRTSWVSEQLSVLQPILLNRVATRFERRRQRDLRTVIASSPYLSDMWIQEPEKAIRKAIQSIRRAPEFDDPRIILRPERVALAKIRANLHCMYWRLYRPPDLSDAVQEHLIKLRGRRLFCRLLCKSLMQNTSVSTVMRSLFRYHLGEAVDFVDFDGDLPEGATDGKGVLSIYFFSCVTLQFRNFSDALECLRNELDQTFAYSKCRKRFERLGFDLRRLFEVCRFVGIVSDVEVFASICRQVRTISIQDRAILLSEIATYYDRILARYAGDRITWICSSALLQQSKVDTTLSLSGLAAPDKELMNKDFRFLKAEQEKFHADSADTSDNDEMLKSLAEFRCRLYGAEGEALVNLMKPFETSILIVNEPEPRTKSEMFRAMLVAQEKLPTVLLPWSTRG